MDSNLFIDYILSLPQTMFLACKRSWEALTQLGAAVVADHPGEHRVLGQVIAAAVGQVVEVQQVLVVGEVAALPLQHVALGRALRHVVLCGGQAGMVTTERGRCWPSFT